MVSRGPRAGPRAAPHLGDPRAPRRRAHQGRLATHGHADPAVTMQVYAHALEGDDATAAEIAAAAIFGDG